MPATSMYNNRGVVPPAGHPTRYSLEKLKGVRKKPKRKVAGVTSVGGEEKPGQVGSRKKGRVAFVQIRNLDATDKVQQLIKLAEDGRKKSNLLPPLEKEPSFSRQPRRATIHQSFIEDESKQYKRVSVEMDRKIVSHLRKHLNKRVQKRLDLTGEHLDYQSDEEDESGRGGNSSRRESQEDAKKNIFSNYSETGEKIQNGGEGRKKRSSLSQPRGSQRNRRSRRSSSSSDRGVANGHGVAASPTKGSRRLDDNNLDFNKPSPLPGIRRESGSKSEGEGLSSRKSSLTSVKGGNTKALMTEVTNVESVGAETELPVFTEEGDEEEEEEEEETIEDFRLFQVSPVQTPTLTRPQTRENTRLSFTERMTQILDGRCDVRCLPDKTVINLFMASGYSDTEPERSFMQEHLYPRIRDFCKHRGHELRILDLQWGFSDVMSDDHIIPDVIRKAIDKAHDSDLGINFVILLGQKYGIPLLPSEIPQDEFEAICHVASLYIEREKRILHIKMADIEAQREKRKTMDDTESIATDTQPNSARTNDDSMSTIMSSRRDDDESDSKMGNSLSVKDKQRRQSLAVKKEQQDLRALREAEEQLPDLACLHQWYVLDENAVPPVYRLQNISTVYKDILRNDSTKRSGAKSSFSVLANKMHKTLKMFAPEVLDNKRSLSRYFSSVLEMEINYILDHETAAGHTACILRTIEGLTGHMDDSVASQYLDLLTDKPPTLDKEAWTQIERLRNEFLDGRIPEKKVFPFPLEWTPGGIRPQSNREHLVYAERTCKTLFDLVTHNLVENAHEEGETNGWQCQLFAEVAEHVRRCHEISKVFQGRKDVLTLIKSYIKSDCARPLVLHGKTGCGKTAILCKTAKEIFKWYKGSDQEPRVLVRVIGCSMKSTNVRTLLRDICLQLCQMFGLNPSEVPTDYKGIFNDLGCRIGHASQDRPLILILDGVDRLSDDHEGRKLQWLPPALPPHVRLIISTISDDKFDCLPCAKKIFGVQNALLEVGELPHQDALAIVSHSLESANRNLTNQQFDVVMETFAKCPYPLFLKVAIREAIGWTSYMKPEAAKLGETVKKVATLRFGRLERDHGEPLTRRALGYISASRHGLSSNEMEDLLSLDDMVMDDVMATYRPQKRRLPSLVWVQLLDDMDDLIAECRADNMKTITWAHSQIAEAAEERYLNQKDKAPSYHKALAEYFMGQWAGRSKPHTGSEKGSDRLVARQDLYYEPVESTGDGLDRVYNLRKINELPFHLMRSQQTGVLKQACLCNYEWMLGKLCGTSVRSLLEEYQAILTAEPHEPELRLLSDVLHLSGKALHDEPRQLASQIVGRLYKIIAADHPRAPGDPKKYPNLHVLMAAAKDSSIPVLIPSVECLTEPGGILFDLLSGHSEPITALTLTSDGSRALTTSKDRTMKLWDIRSGKVVKSIDGVCPNVSAVRTAKGNTLAVTVMGSIIKIWSLKSSSCVWSTDEFVDPASISVAAEGQILVAVFDGSNTFRSWNMDNFSLLCEAAIPDYSIHKDNSILIADSSFGDHVLHAFRSGNMATIQHARNGKILKSLKCNEKSSSIVALAISREYFIVGCRQQYMALHEVISLELFDARKGSYIRCVRGCVQDNFRQLFTNVIGSHAIAVSTNPRNNTSDVALYNLETEDHKHLANHPCVSTMGACLDFRYCMTGCETENSLRIWDLTSKVNQPAPKLKKQLGVSDILPMIDNPRYVVAKTVNNGPISVWNVAKGKCLQSAVRIERGLTEGSDALVMRNTRLVVLTDRGFSNVSDDSRPVFQTVLVYDLKLKKYIRKLPGCYIVPAPSHEYVLLDNDLLLGPSDNRSHFIIWNLVSGHAVARIKTNFKELERKRLEQGVNLVDVPKVKRGTSAAMTPWDRRAESKSARRRRHDNETEKEKQRLEELRKEKDNVVEQFIVSGNQKVIVASFYAHHLCVFDIESQTHTQTLQTEYSMMFLHTSALTYDGSHLVHANYDEDSKISYVTLWDCGSGEVKRRLRKETNVSALAITDDAQRVVIGRTPNELHVWDPMKSNSLRRIRGYDGLRFEINSKIFVVEDGAKAIVFARDISVWDLERGTVLAVFTPDTRIMVCNVVLNGQLIVFGMYDKPDLVILKLMSKGLKTVEDAAGVDLFGETTGDTSDEDDADDEEENDDD